MRQTATMRMGVRARDRAAQVLQAVAYGAAYVVPLCWAVVVALQNGAIAVGAMMGAFWLSGFLFGGWWHARRLAQSWERLAQCARDVEEQAARTLRVQLESAVNKRGLEEWRQ